MGGETSSMFLPVSVKRMSQLQSFQCLHPKEKRIKLQDASRTFQKEKFRWPRTAFPWAASYLSSHHVPFSMTGRQQNFTGVFFNFSTPTLVSLLKSYTGYSSTGFYTKVKQLFKFTRPDEAQEQDHMRLGVKVSSFTVLICSLMFISLNDESQHLLDFYVSRCTALKIYLGKLFA